MSLSTIGAKRYRSSRMEREVDRTTDLGLMSPAL